MKGRLLLALRVAIGLGLLLYVISATGGWAGTQKLFTTPWLFPSLVALVFFGAAIESKRMGILFRPHQIPISFLYGYQLVAISALFNFCIPGGTGGDVVKGYYLVSSHKKKGIEIATIILADRVIALFSLLVLILLLALINMSTVLTYPLVGGLVLLSGVGAVLLVLGTALSWSVSFRESRLYAYIVTHIVGGAYLARMSDAIFVFRSEKSALFWAGWYSMIGHIALAGMFYLAGQVFFNSGIGLAICLISLLGMLANALPITPGGLGVGEAAFEGLFRGLGYEGGAHLILAWRIGMIPICIVGAIIYMGGVKTPFSDIRKSMFPMS